MSGAGTTWACVAATLAVILAATPPSHGGQALVDVLDGATLEATQPHLPVAPERTLDLLLVEVARQRLAVGALHRETMVQLTIVSGEGTVAHIPNGQRAVGELLDLVLLTRSRSAVASLASSVGPGWEQARLRLRHAVTRLALTDTTVPDRWPSESAGPHARSSLGDLARVAGAVVQDGDMRRRLALDGSPIANGAVIVRATDPLIACAPPINPPAPAARRAPAPGNEPDAAMAIGSRDGLDLLAVATGDDAATAVWHTLEQGLARYRRVEVVREGAPFGAEIEVSGGTLERFRAVAAQPFALTVPRRGGFMLKAWLQLPDRIAAPVEARQPVGELVFADDKGIIAAIPLVAPSAIAPGWIDTARR